MKISYEVRIGLIAIVTIALFIWGFHFMKGKNILSSSSTYTIIYDKVNGLEESNAVLISGYRVGLVDDIRFLPDNSGRLQVIILIEEKFRIPKNTVAQIYSADLMGSRAIRLNLGDSEEICENGDTLLPDVEGTLQEQVSVEMLPLKNKAENLMLSIDSVLAVIQSIFNENFRTNFSASFEHIRTTILNLQRSTYTLDTLLTNEEGRVAHFLTNIESISSNLESSNVEISNILQNLSTITDSLAQSQIRSTINNLDLTFARMDSILTRVNEGEGTLGMLVMNDTLYQNLEDATRSLDELLKDLKENPKRYVHVSVFGGKSDK